MHFTALATLAATVYTVTADSSYDVYNYCDDKKYLTLSNNDQGIVQYNAELPSGTSRHYEIDGPHSLVVANTTDYWSASTSKLDFGTNSAANVLYYAMGLVNGYPLQDRPFSVVATNAPSCPSINVADGSTKGCADNNVNFRYVLCTSDV